MKNSGVGMSVNFSTKAEEYVRAVWNMMLDAGVSPESNILIITFPLATWNAREPDKRTERAPNGGPLVSIGWISKDKLNGEHRVMAGDTTIAIRRDSRTQSAHSLAFDYNGQLLLSMS
ncbi:MAG TPA: hypothetical protein PK812_09935 [Beijerinckiaceae bacterium]|nr:hypothetical protein [Beijerinckiaceae bacterium]